MRWEQAQLDHHVTDIFGYHAVQMGMPQLQALRANRVPHRWLALPPELISHDEAYLPKIATCFESLAFETQSLDLVVLPHVLDLSHDPHQVLRETERVLRPEGRLIVMGFNPWSLWRMQGQWGQSISAFRLKDWLRLLNFEIEGGCFGCYRPACQNEKNLARVGFMEKAGDRWWPVFGATYMIMGIKRVRGMRFIGPAWKNTPLASHGDLKAT